jgi:hypothetical protein
MRLPQVMVSLPWASDQVRHRANLPRAYGILLNEAIKYLSVILLGFWCFTRLPIGVLYPCFIRAQQCLIGLVSNFYGEYCMKRKPGTCRERTLFSIASFWKLKLEYPLNTTTCVIWQALQASNSNLGSLEDTTSLPLACL